MPYNHPSPRRGRANFLRVEALPLPLAVYPSTVTKRASPGWRYFASRTFYREKVTSFPPVCLFKHIHIASEGKARVTKFHPATLESVYLNYVHRIKNRRSSLCVLMGTKKGRIDRIMLPHQQLSLSLGARAMDELSRHLHKGNVVIVITFRSQ